VDGLAEAAIRSLRDGQALIGSELQAHKGAKTASPGGYKKGDDPPGHLLLPASDANSLRLLPQAAQTSNTHS
jgi:hypothetical protein